MERIGREEKQLRKGEKRMVKKQEMERCILCNGFIQSLVPGNQDALEQIQAVVYRFFREASPESCLMLITPVSMLHSQSRVVYTLCADCCQRVLQQALSLIINQKRKILFRKFT